MAGTRKSARMSERRRLEEEDEERKREDDRKRQRTLFHRTDNVIRKNDMVVDTRLGKVALVPEEASEDVKVKVEPNDEQEEIQQLDNFEFSDEGRGVVFVTHEVDMPITAGQVEEQGQDNRQETDDNNGTPTSSSGGVEVKQETNASQSTTATNEEYEAMLTSLRLELEGMKLLVKERDQKIVQLTTQLETVKTKEPENITQFKRELEPEENFNPAQDHSQDVAVLSSESNESSGNGTDTEKDDTPQLAEGSKTRTPMILDPDLEAVLSRIFKFLGKDVQALKTFRLVSCAWNQVSLPIWRNTAVITLLPDLAASCTTGGIKIFQFLRELDNDQSPLELAKKPYSRYKLANLFIDERNYWDRFWDLIGPLMEYVHFQDCVIAYTTTDAFPEMLIEKLPNLKELSLTSVKYHSFEDIDTQGPLLKKNHSQLKSLIVSGENNIFLDRLLVYLPNLESIQATSDGEKIVFDDTLDEISYAKLRKPDSLPNLKHLDLMNTFSQLKFLTVGKRRSFPQLQLQKLLRANLRLELKSFAMTCVPLGEMGYPDIDPFLTSQANTLEVLKLFQVPISGNEFSMFLCRGKVQMTALKEIYLWGCITVGLGFLKYTPNLKVLYVNMTCLEERDRLKQAMNLFRNAEDEKFEGDMVEFVSDEMEGVVVESLETLYIDYEFPEKSLRALAKWAPNLKVLKTIVSGKNVSAVVEEWRELKELTCLFGSKLRDWNISKDDTRSRRRRKKGAVISDLKKLERFQLDCLCDSSKLTDASVFHGLLKMPALKSVQICVSKQFSDEAEEALKDRVKNCRVIRNYTGGDHSNYECCQRREFDLEVAATGFRVKSNDDEEESEGGNSNESEEDVDM